MPYGILLVSRLNVLTNYYWITKAHVDTAHALNKSMSGDLQTITFHHNRNLAMQDFLALCLICQLLSATENNVTNFMPLTCI